MKKYNIYGVVISNLSQVDLFREIPMVANYPMNIMNNHTISEDTAEDVYNNTSEIRDGCRLDIHEDYCLDDEEERYYISYLWALENGIIYATIYDNVDDRYIGDIEIKA